MKKVLSVFFVFTILISFGLLSYADDDDVQSSTGESIIIIQDDPSEQSQEESVSSEPTATPEPTAEPTPTPTPDLYPVITKDPTNESVSTEGRAVFIARADNATSITWYFISPDGSTTILASSIPTLFPGITVSGTDTEKLVLTNVNTKISGYSAYARFGNSNGFTDSATATVTVSPLISPTVSPAATASPVPSAVPSSTPKTEVSPTPTAQIIESTPTPSPSVYVESAENSSSSSRRSGSISFGAVLLLILSLAVIIGASVVLSLYIRGSIDLTWLEDLFTRHSSKESVEKDVPESDFDSSDDYDVMIDGIPDKFYDPNDYKK